MEDEDTTLTEDERNLARTRVVRKAIRYFEAGTKKSGSCTRRRNLAAHLGVDETTSRQEVQSINQYSLPAPASALQFQEKNCLEVRYKCS